MILFKKTEAPLTQTQIANWLRELRGRPYNPSSDFDVTAVFRVKFNDVDTYYFAGVNVENPDLRLGTHGEEGCIAAMTTAFGKGAEVVEGWVMGAPKHLKMGDTHPLADNKVTCCGKCRQQIAGLAGPSVIMHSLSLNGAHGQTTIAEFLPDAFSFRQFVPELMNPVAKPHVTLSDSAIQSKIYRQGPLSEHDLLQWLKQLECVDYATKSGQAIIIRLDNGCYVAGVSVEEAAYVSINAAQSAVAIANTLYGRVRVEEVWTLPKDRQEITQDQLAKPEGGSLPQFSAFKQLSKEAAILAEKHQPLTLSAVQTIAEFASHGNIAIHMFNSYGAKKTIALHESATLLTVFPKPATGSASEQSTQVSSSMQKLAL